MREYKFRGCDAVGNKGWVYGDLVHGKKCNREEPYLTDRIMVGGYEVVPESVGIRLYEVEGVTFYDGDIVAVDGTDKKFVLKMDNDGMIRGYEVGTDFWVNFHTLISTFVVKVVGTKFDAAAYGRGKGSESEQ